MEKRVYIGNTGHIKNHENFKNLFWSWESEKSIFTIFPEIFYENMGWNTGITSETTGTWESRVRRRALSERCVVVADGDRVQPPTQRNRRVSLCSVQSFWLSIKSRSSLPLLARCQIWRQADHADFYKIRCLSY